MHALLRRDKRVGFPSTRARSCEQLLAGHVARTAPFPQGFDSVLSPTCVRVRRCSSVRHPRHMRFYMAAVRSSVVADPRERCLALPQHLWLTDAPTRPRHFHSLSMTIRPIRALHPHAPCPARLPTWSRCHVPSLPPAALRMTHVQHIGNAKQVSEVEVAPGTRQALEDKEKTPGL